MDYPFTSNLAVDLGRIGFETAYRLQKELVERIRKGHPYGFLLFLEHDPVYTVGRKPIPENYSGVDPVVTERGGDITYHGPGQLVIYPIFNLETDGKVDVRKFVHFVEDSTISILNDAGYSASVGDEPGIWVSTANGEKKVASIGMAIDHGISYHGISVNLTNEPLKGFSRIRPCGLDPSVMDYARLSRKTVVDGFLRAFSSRFGPMETIGRDPFLDALSFAP